MQLFDPAGQEVVPFAPRDGGVGIYVCGITPYDSAHLGHAFVYHVFDIITRRFREAGLAVRSVRNVTDVDDDILRVARERSVPYRESPPEQARMLDTDIAQIVLRPADVVPRSPDHVASLAARADAPGAPGRPTELHRRAFLGPRLVPPPAPSRSDQPSVFVRGAAAASARAR